MDLTDLKMTISDMSDSDLMNLIRDIRSSRRVSKNTNVSKTRAKSVKKSTDINIESMLRNIPADKLEQLINTLESEAKK